MTLRSLLDLEPFGLLRAPDGEGEGATASPPPPVPPAAAEPPVQEGEDGLTPPATGEVEEPKVQEIKTEAPEPETPTEPEEPAEPTGKTPAWVMPRIAKLSARIRELESGQQVDTKAGGVPPTTTEPSPPPEGSVRLADGRVLTNQELQVEIARQAALIELNTNLVKMVDQGNKEFPDFQQSIATLRDGLGIMTQPFLEAVLETGDAHRVLHALANDPDKATHIASLTPVRQAVAVAKFAADLNKAPQVSSAPAPIGKPKVRGSARAPLELDDPGVSMDEFMKKRNAHEAELRKNGQWR